MVEPLAAGALHSLTSCATRRPSATLGTMGRALVTACSKPTTYFAMPSPRGTKGKGKASSDCADHLSQCQEWSCCASRHSIWCPVRLPHALLQEFDEGQHRRSRRGSSQTILPKVNPVNTPGPLRRHASHAVRYAQSYSSQRPSLAPLNQTDGSAVPKLTRRDACAELTNLLRKSSEMNIDTAWAFYESAKHNDILKSLPMVQLFRLSEAMLDCLEKSYGQMNLEKVHTWGGRMETIVDDLRQCDSGPSDSEAHWSCLRVRALALQVDLPRTTQALQAAKDLEQAPLASAPRLLLAFEGVILALQHNYGPLQVLDFILDNWDDLSPFIAPKTAILAAPLLPGRFLRRTAYNALCDIADPDQVITRNADWDRLRRWRAGNLLIEALCALHLPRDAYRIVRAMERDRFNVRDNVKLCLTRSLAKDGQFDNAKSLFDSVSASLKFRYRFSTGLYLYAQQGDFLRASSYFTHMKHNDWVTGYDVAQWMCAFAVAGKRSQVMRIFLRYFHPDKPEKHKYKVDSHHYGYLLLAFAREGKMEGVRAWWQTMIDSGHRPDAHTYTILMEGYARLGDQDEIMRLLEEMQQEGIQPTAVTYTTIITLLAHRKDPVAAEAIYLKALQEGIIPDRAMITSMMNAHVEAGSWAGVIRIFDYLKTKPKQRLRLTIEVYNTVIKAYVLIGAPFKIVSNLFSTLERSHVHPDAYTFALLVQSACDAQLMDVASDIFLEVDKLSKDNRPTLTNAYILTIILSGFLRIGDKTRAKAVYDDMLDRGIKPTVITFSTILRAYGNERNEESLKIAENFVQKLLASSGEERDWDKPSHGRKTALEKIYGPLINAYSRQLKVEDVERLIQDFLETGNTPSLGLLSALLDVYRRTFDIEGVRQLWPEIFRLGLKQSRSEPLFKGDNYDPSRGRLQGNILCLPFSIYTDALSAAGFHEEVMQVWKQFQDHKFTFDSHNWNHLVVALVRGGETRRAFEVVEKVILPYQRMTERVQDVRDPTPDTPLIFYTSAKENPENDVTEVPSEPPMHRERQRAVTVERWTRELFTNTDLASLEHEDDSVRLLQVMHQISPTWDVWKPHAATMATLQHVLTTLRAGRLIHPLGTIPVDDEKEGDKAMRLLDSIIKDYPDTVRLVDEHEATGRRLGRDYDSS